MFDNDDLPVGKILSRREALALFGITGSAALLAACAPIGGMGRPGGPPPGGAAGGDTADLSAIEATNATLPPTCVVRPELTEGPLFVDEGLDRADIRNDPSNSSVREGIQFDLTFRVSSVGGNSCSPLSGVKIDIWHCDALGVYSDTNQLGMSSVGQKFLRGYQMTDNGGVARFTTIYPGWYQGRAVHIHFKIRNEQGYEFTSQLFFDEALNDEVFQNAPYASKGNGRIRNENDGIYQQSGGQLLLNVEKVDTGYAATFDIGLQLDA